MTTTASTRKRRPRPNSSAPAAATLAKPVTADDIDRLHELARRLEGRPVPGVCMTETQFEAWCDEDVKAEWVEGEVVLMSPENLRHVDLMIWLLAILRPLAEQNDSGRVLGPNFLVRLPRQRRRRVPDVLFVATDRLQMLRDTFLEGAPDLAIEIVSPDSQSRDWREKYAEYERAGVREYWIIDPQSRRVEAYGLGKCKRYVRLPEADGRITSTALPGFHLRPEWLRQPNLPRVTTVM